MGNRAANLTRRDVLKLGTFGAAAPISGLLTPSISSGSVARASRDDDKDVRDAIYFSPVVDFDYGRDCVSGGGAVPVFPFLAGPSSGLIAGRIVECLDSGHYANEMGSTTRAWLDSTPLRDMTWVRLPKGREVGGSIALRLSGKGGGEGESALVTYDFDYMPWVECEGLYALVAIWDDDGELMHCKSVSVSRVGNLELSGVAGQLPHPGRYTALVLCHATDVPPSYEDAPVADVREVRFS